MITFMDIEGGGLALTKRPKLRDLPGLRGAGATHLITLLAERDAAQLGKAAQVAGLAWMWLPIPHGDPPDAARDAEFRRHLQGFIELMRGGARLVIHCSGGVHRTGMIAYALLRQLGMTSEAARSMLARLRDVAAEGVGEHRLAWGDRLAE